LSEALRAGNASSGDRARSTSQLQSATARFPRSEPKASGEIHEARGRTRSSAHRPQPRARFPRSEAKPSGEVHRARARTGNQLSGFTLIEMLAVVMMFGLIAAMVIPNINLGGSRVARGEAQDLAAAIEFARQRAVMTGRMHQVVIEVDRGQHWVEWAAPHDPESEAPAADAAAPGEQKLDLVPPPLETEEFVPIPGELGRVHTASDQVAILGVELDGGVADQGRVELRISPDGAADPATILIGDADGKNAVRIEVEPLADAVRVSNVE
jgi:type II secretion system protein H